VSPEGFNSMTPPFIVQEYRDHNESFFKVYVINDEVMAFRRPSLPNLDDLAVLAGNERNMSRERKLCCLKPQYRGLKNVAFDSRYAYPTAEDFKDTHSTPHSTHSTTPHIQRMV
jgi:Inositol 1,3,4-trisphosphate 5/6-kinase ATP-grasp domain